MWVIATACLALLMLDDQIRWRCRLDVSIVQRQIRSKCTGNRILRHEKLYGPQTRLERG